MFMFASIWSIYNISIYADTYSMELISTHMKLYVPCTHVPLTLRMLRIETFQTSKTFSPLRHPQARSSSSNYHWHPGPAAPDISSQTRARNFMEFALLGRTPSISQHRLSKALEIHRPMMVQGNCSKGQNNEFNFDSIQWQSASLRFGQVV